MRTSIFFTIIALVLIFSCQKSSTDNAGIFIRIENASIYDYSNIQINPNPTNDHLFGNLNAGEKSAYQQYEHAYSYGHVKLFIDSNSYQLIPIDYIGESVLEDGYYTYKIGATDQTSNEFGRLTHEFIVN